MQYSNLLQELVPAVVAERLIELCSSQAKVAWFVSGGSNIAVQVATMQILQGAGVDLSRLTIMLNDERFGPVGHADSNWHQLEQAGFMVAGPHYIAPFTEHETTLPQAVERYENLVTEIMAQHYAFSQLGMGDDGHVAGILPESPAAKTDETFVFGYAAEPYERLTTTFAAITQFDEVVLVAYGETKWPKLRELGNDIERQALPLQVITALRKVTIYTDCTVQNT